MVNICKIFTGQQTTFCHFFCCLEKCEHFKDPPCYSLHVFSTFGALYREKFVNSIHQDLVITLKKKFEEIIRTIRVFVELCDCLWVFHTRLPGSCSL